MIAPNKKFAGALNTTPAAIETLTGAIIATTSRDCQASGEGSATMTLPSDQIEYVSPLKLSTGHSDHTLKQVWRDKTHAVYQHFGSYGQFIGWEAILIKVKPEAKIFGKAYPAREVYPGNEDFGRYALSVGAQYDLKHAIKKALKLQQIFPRTTNQTGTDMETYSNKNKLNWNRSKQLEPNYIEKLQIIRRWSLPIETGLRSFSKTD